MVTRNRSEGWKHAKISGHYLIYLLKDVGNRTPLK